ncbi:ABC transporter ATP-binding protein [Actinoplanes sp. KI2]|uniref:ABC transporter ATP-binding protein n=1 Tax=Actinoplanes sp. KI2 TaxID=2983315 RepID=UPI0021D59E46|nr:ABC transporter ATP-binding protein [Actinoplanes sp. KI2]MCU7722332.1 ABC transporter ATP-binding protein [Actinoplanes sp. KI2]
MSIGQVTPRSFLEVKDLTVRFETDDGIVQAVTGSTFSLQKGKTLGIVGESGSGKSVTSLAMLGLHRTRSNAKVTGEIWLDDEELVTATDEKVRTLRGGKISMIFQDPLSAMHPYFTVGSQIVEAYRVHHPGVNKRVARERAIDMLARVGIPQPERRFNDYAHQFSGGMRQRAMIAMALVNDPALLIADEPTTALDVTVQAQILDLIRDLQEEFGSAVIMITHDLGVVAELADDVLVMYGGKVIEKGSALDVFRTPQHPYTWGLLGSMPRLDRDVRDRLTPVKGTPPSLINLPDGCAFNPRCPYAGRNGNRSFTEMPVLRDAGAGTGAGHLVACHLPAEDRTKIFQQEVLPNL